MALTKEWCWLSEFQLHWYAALEQEDRREEKQRTFWQLDFLSKFPDELLTHVLNA